MVGKAGERCHGGEGLPDTLEMWKARALAFRETLDTLKAQRDEARVERNVAAERMRIAEAKYDAEHADWLELDAKYATLTAERDAALARAEASEQRVAALVEAGNQMAGAIADVLASGAVSWHPGHAAMSAWSTALAGSAVAGEG